MRQLGWILIHANGALIRRLGHRHVQKEDQVKTQGGDSQLRGKERGLRAKPAHSVISDLHLPEL